MGLWAGILSLGSEERGLSGKSNFTSSSIFLFGVSSTNSFIEGFYSKNNEIS
jgi:hypothetical protein